MLHYQKPLNFILITILSLCLIQSKIGQRRLRAAIDRYELVEVLKLKF